MSHIIEVDSYNLFKYGQRVAGDTFLVCKTKDRRIVSTLADGLGSGVKANVLSELTAVMSQKFMAAGIDSIRAANTIMETLPICSRRKVSYSTFTTLNIAENGITKILEYDNPEIIWLRGTKTLEIERTPADIKTNTKRNTIFYSEIKLRYGDRLILFSDGVTQAGLGSAKYSLGWGMNNVREYIQSAVMTKPDISAKELARSLVSRASQIDSGKPKDDITCGVVYYREARETLLVTGPPYDRGKCSYLVEKFKMFKGKKIISGGTTSQIIAEGLNEKITTDMKDVHSDIPPRSIMKGADLVTEGMLTINKTIKILEEPDTHKNIEDIDAAHKLVQLLLDSDKIYFLVGTAINEMHQSPNIPMELGIRRISMNNLTRILREKYLKEVFIEYV